jgi:hypothetical protein
VRITPIDTNSLIRHSTNLERKGRPAPSIVSLQTVIDDIDKRALTTASTEHIHQHLSLGAQLL